MINIILEPLHISTPKPPWTGNYKELDFNFLEIQNAQIFLLKYSVIILQLLQNFIIYNIS